MAATPTSPAMACFGPYRLDLASGVLEKHGVRVRLARQPSQVLTILVQRAGDVVTRDELHEKLWGTETFVDFEHGLNAAVNKLRQALDDSPEKPRYVETLSGRGYRFLAAVDSGISTPVPLKQEASANTKEVARPSRHAVILLAMVGGLGLGVLGMAVLMGSRHKPSPVQTRAVRFVVSAPEGFAFEPSAFRQAFALSPDGSRLAFTALGEDGRFRMWLRNLAELEAHEVPIARGLHTLFWSPDGTSLYFGVGRSLRRMGANDEVSSEVISDLPRRVPGIGAWLPPDKLLLSDRQATSLMPASGGRATPVDKPYLWPQVLPDGKHILYLAYDIRLGRFRLRVSTFGQSQPPIEILETDSRVTYVGSKRTENGGYLVYVRAGSLLAQAFDVTRLRLTGDPISLAGGVHFFPPTGAADFAVSESGDLVYQSLAKNSRILWLDRSGRELTEVGAGEISVKCVRASPDGRKVAAVIYSVEKGSSEIWVFDAVSKVNRLVIAGPGLVDTPVWSADSSRLLYVRAVGSGPTLFTRGLGESDREQALASAPFQLATDWSRDGRFALYNTENVTDGDLGAVDLESRKATPILSTPAHETGAVFSPDGQWVAFISDASGESEAYVQGFRAGDPPSLSGDRTRISRRGAQSIRWRGDGKELIYLGPDGMFYGVSITLPQLRIGAPVSLFRMSVASMAVLPTVFGFDVSADGSRLLVSTVREPHGPNLVVIRDWESLLRHPVQ